MPRTGHGAAADRRLRCEELGPKGPSRATFPLLPPPRLHDRASGPPRAFGFHQDQIIQVGPTNAPVLTFSLPRKGDYLVSGSVRAFSRASNPGHNLNCFFDTGVSPDINNAWVDELRYIPLAGLLTTSMPNQSVSLSCQQIQGSGEITLTYDLALVPVDAGD